VSRFAPFFILLLVVATPGLINWPLSFIDFFDFADDLGFD
jgi:hypothetical protein